MINRLANYKLNIRGIIFIYIMGVVIYGSLMFLFSSPVHVGVDEQLYISMARSFHYDHNFAVGGLCKDYGSILYSMLISLAYFFYSPQNIMLYMRLINVVVCVSAVFPIYLLSKEYGLEEKNIKIAVLLSLMIPEMMNVAYMMQEVLLYPLFMWSFFCIYKDVNVDKINRWTFASTAMLGLCYFTKTSALALVGGYLFFYFVEFIKRDSQKKELIKKVVVIIVVFGILYLAEGRFIDFCNSGMPSDNHYADQILSIYPIDMSLFVEIAVGVIFYITFSLIAMGIGMAITSLTMTKDNLSKLSLIMMLMMIFEVVVCILCTENRGNFWPNKQYFRYIYYFYVPLLLCFLKNKDRIHIDKKISISWMLCPIMATIYFGVKGTDIIEGIMDADLIALIVNINNRVFNGFSVLVALALLIIYLILIFINQRKNVNFPRLYTKVAFCYCILFFIVNAIQLPLYSNTIAGGINIEKDAITVEQLINDIGYEDVITIVYEDGGYNGLVGTYLSADVDSFRVSAIDTRQTRDLCLIEKSIGDVELGLEYSIICETDLFKVYGKNI